MSEIVFAAYKPHPGKEKELEKLIGQHVPTLRELELITDRQPLTLKSKNGTYIEVIEWRDVNSADMAHEHPAVAKIWESMAKVSDFKAMNSLEETDSPFSHYQVIE